MFRDIDFWNIVLMLLSVIVAFIFPFELFLFSYIILGPIHYLTEIGWLKERNYFIPKDRSKTFFFVLAALSIIISIYSGLLGFDLFENYEFITLDARNILFSTLLFLLIALAIGFYFFKSPFYIAMFSFVALGLGLVLSENIWFVIIIGLFVPTLIHTTLFTGAFMLEGALKSKKNLGLVAFVIFIFCNLIFFTVPDFEPNVLTRQWTQNLFIEGDFFYVNLNFYNLFFGESSGPFVLDSTVGLRIQAFIAFAYTYHYLNWFSKTEVIKWHLIPKKWIYFSAIIWITSVIIHLINAKAGIMFIATISLLHVYLEFPLNMKSFGNIGKLIFHYTR